MFRSLARLFRFALTTPNYVGAPPGQNHDVFLARVACVAIVGAAGVAVGGAGTLVRWAAVGLGIWP